MVILMSSEYHICKECGEYFKCDNICMVKSDFVYCLCDNHDGARWNNKLCNAVILSANEKVVYVL